MALRAITEALGDQVDWNSESQTATARVGDAELIVTVSVRTALRGKAVELPVTPVVHVEILMVPGHLLADLLGVQIHLSDGLVELLGALRRSPSPSRDMPPVRARANILNGQYNTTGIGTVHGGQYGSMFTQEFVGR